MRLGLVALCACSGAPAPAPMPAPPAPVATTAAPDKAVLTGRVLVDGVPAHELVVTIKYQRWRFRDRDGRFTIANLEPDVMDIKIAGPTFASRKLLGREVTAGKNDLGDISVGPGRVIEGHVRDAAGKAVAGAEVGLGFGVERLDADGDPAEPWMRTTTDDRGVYRFEHVEADTMIIAWTATLMSDQRRLDPSQRIADLYVHETGGIEGTTDYDLAVFASGRTLAYAEVSGGRFRFDRLLPGAYQVRVAHGLGSASPPPQRVVVVANARSTVHIAAPANPISITFSVREPCTTVQLGFAYPGSRFMRDEVGMARCENGNATIIGVTPGAYDICDALDCEPIVVAPTPAQQSFDLR